MWTQLWLLFMEVPFWPLRISRQYHMCKCWGWMWLWLWLLLSTGVPFQPMLSKFCRSGLCNDHMCLPYRCGHTGNTTFLIKVGWLLVCKFAFKIHNWTCLIHACVVYTCLYIAYWTSLYFACVHCVDMLCESIWDKFATFTTSYSKVTMLQLPQWEILHQKGWKLIEWLQAWVWWV